MATASATTSTPTTPTAPIPLTEEGKTAVPFQQPVPLPRTPPRNIYEKRDDAAPFWDAPLIVAVVANVVWPAVLLVLTMWSMLVVLYFRLTRLVSEVVWRTPDVELCDDDAPVDMGLYWFGLDNKCEKWQPAAAETGGKKSKKKKTKRGVADQHGHSQFFDPNKPSVIYVHGFSRRTTARKFRETFNWSHNDPQYGLDINSADRWVREGWNIGIFFWNNHADEEMPQDTESKIWTSNGRCGMRYRTICPKKGHVTFYASSRPSKSISQVLMDLLADVFRGSTAGYRLVGHSLGTQVVVHATTLLSQRKAREEKEEAERRNAAAAALALAEKMQQENVDSNSTTTTTTSSSSSSHLKKLVALKASSKKDKLHHPPKPSPAPLALPTRIALLDVFGTLGVKAYLSGWPIMLVVQKEMVALRNLGIVFEQYQTSLIGRRGHFLRHLTAFVQLDPPGIPWYRLRSRHVAAMHMYFLSFSHAADGPKLRKADLRRHQSAEIYFTQGGSITGSNSSSSTTNKHGHNVLLEIDLQALLQEPVQQQQPPKAAQEAPAATGSPRRLGSPISSLLRRRNRWREDRKSNSSSSLSTLCEGTAASSASVVPRPPPLLTALPPSPPSPSAAKEEQEEEQDGQNKRYRFSPRAYDGHNKNHLRVLTASSYVKNEVGDFPLHARASDEEVRQLMNCNYAYKQYQGNLFLRVSRAW